MISCLLNNVNSSFEDYASAKIWKSARAVEKSFYSFPNYFPENNDYSIKAFFDVSDGFCVFCVNPIFSLKEAHSVILIELWDDICLNKNLV